MLLFHLANLPTESIGRMIYEEQRKLELPNSLVSECCTILAEINVRESLLKCLTKPQFRKIIHEKLIDKNKREILSMCKTYRKINCNEMEEEEFQLKDFFKSLTLSRARTLFSVKVNMIRASMNYMSDPISISQGWVCKSCSDNVLCSTSHLTVCRRFQHLQNIDWGNDHQVANYFIKIIKIREDDEKVK